jgi:hypothetical protein
MNDVIVHQEVSIGKQGHWRLCFQWCTYTFAAPRPTEDGYRFIWRRPDNTLQPARGQARIPSLADLQQLLTLAAQAGWLVTAESPNARFEIAGSRAAP